MQSVEKRPNHSKSNRMKRQRDMQQMKEFGKNPPDQINEETGSLPEKEFRVMLIKMIQKKEKMIQNLRNKMESQIWKSQNGSMDSEDTRSI